MLTNSVHDDKNETNNDCDREKTKDEKVTCKQSLQVVGGEM